MCNCNCHRDQFDASTRPRKRGGIIRFLVQMVFLYAVLVFGGGTLIQTGHPVAVEVGELLHTVLFVDPALQWAASEGHGILASGLHVLSEGWGG